MTGYGDMAVQGGDLRECTTNQVFYSNNKLPPEILAYIFRHIEYEIQLLLNCRLVCKHWKSVVDSPELIRSLTFNIRSNDDWDFFKDSTIVSKVKSLRIFQPIRRNDEFKDMFLLAEKIGESVEKIIFDFRNIVCTERLCDAADLTLILLIASQKLEELHILNSLVVGGMRPVWSSEDLTLPANIKKLVLVGNAEGLQAITPRFRKLATIEVESSNFGTLEDKKIYSVLHDYVTLVNDGSLKDVALNWNSTQNSHEWFKFYFALINRGISVRARIINLVSCAKDFLTYKETSGAPINENTCQKFEKAWLDIKDLPVSTKRFGYCKNLKYLWICFARPADTTERGNTDELIFLHKLQNLEDLHLITPFFFCPSPWMGLDVSLCPREVLEHSFPLLRKLFIRGDLFGLADASDDVYSLFHRYFPNLKYLHLCDVQIVPENLFMYLSKLQVLELIGLWDCKLNDSMFTTAADENRVSMPAITRFKFLKKLEILNCKDLTDICITNGIAFNETLEQVSLLNFYQQFTRGSEHALTNAGFEYYELVDRVNFIRNQLPISRMAICANEKLAEQILHTIFQWFEDKDITTLLRCRLVCKNWKSAVDNSVKLMKRLTVNLAANNWEGFGASTIADKIKSVRINQLWDPKINVSSHLNFFCFVDKIGESIEKIIFDFKEIHSSELVSEYILAISTLISTLHLLKELHFLNPVVVSKLPEIVTYCRLAGLRLETLKTLNLVTTTEPLEKILYLFPKLAKLQIQKSAGEDKKIYSTLCEYAKLENCALKEIVLDWPFEQNSPEWFRFIFVMSSRCIKINFASQIIKFEDAVKQYFESNDFLNNKINRQVESFGSDLIHATARAAETPSNKKANNTKMKKIWKALICPLSLI